MEGQLRWKLFAELCWVNKARLGGSKPLQCKLKHKAAARNAPLVYTVKFYGAIFDQLMKGLITNGTISLFSNPIRCGCGENGDQSSATTIQN